MAISIINYYIKIDAMHYILSYIIFNANNKIVFLAFFRKFKKK